MAISKFKKGQSTFKCECCNRLTRDTGVQGVGVPVCPDCYELGSIYNSLQDGDMETVKSCKSEIIGRINTIASKGGKIDSDWVELLQAVKD